MKSTGYNWSAKSKRGRTCEAHAHGVPIGSPPFFYPGCDMCQHKLAAGVVTGLEGPLPTLRQRLRKAKRRTPQQLARVRAGRAKAVQPMPWEK